MSKFKLDTNQGIIFCRVEISKKQQSVFLKMALDTGATYTMVPPEAVMSIGIDPSRSKRKIEVTTGSGIIFVPIITIPRFRAFGFEIKNLEVICHNLPPESAVEGLLGLNFIKHFNVLLKFLQHTLEVNN